MLSASEAALPQRRLPKEPAAGSSSGEEPPAADGTGPCFGESAESGDRGDWGSCWRGSESAPMALWTGLGRSSKPAAELLRFGCLLFCADACVNGTMPHVCCYC